jgi:hypothetical protein
VDRNDADHRFWQYKPVQVDVLADSFLSVSPYLPADMCVEQVGENFVISGNYGIDTFRDDRFLLLVDGQQRTFHRWEDIPQSFDNVIEFTPDPLHDLTFLFTFERAGERFIHSHWIHHDMEPWQDRLRELIARETNGGWNASSHARRGLRHPPLLRAGPGRRLARHLLQREADLPTG